QLAYQLGMVKTMSPKTDMRVIYTHFDDYFKALKNDATLTLPDYDDQGYGFNLINTSGFDSIFLRFENYVDPSTTLSYSVEYIKDNTTLAAGWKADDRMVYSIDFDKVLPGGYTLSVEYKYVDVENNANAKGFGSADINPILPSIPYQQDTLRITMTHNF
ncbi:MAG: hypothetical protein WC337_09285, partial [Candidatus Muiribacteriota bacterium]